MSNDYFKFKRFTVNQDKCAMKVGTDGVLLGAWTKAEGVRRILDVGTGTGVVALMLAQRSKAMIDAVEIDEDAVRQAQQNVAASPWSDRIHVYHTSFQEFYIQRNFLYDLIVSNPPYYHHALKSKGEFRTTARHTVKLNYNELIEYAAKLLTAEGRISVIVPHDISDAFVEYAWFNQLYPLRILKIRSTPSKPFSRTVIEFIRKKNHRPEISEFTIMQGNNRSITEEYKRLTAEYYL
ncbi:MAG: methyltransferase [Bacteroidales bacterium]|nr:methyltransferase [Bacteroidales bacterium]